MTAGDFFRLIGEVAGTQRIGRCAVYKIMLTFILWLVLLIFCWPLALLALILYPFIWLLLLPFRLVGIAVDGVFELLKAILTLPARILGGPKRI
jgi:hypothetical protein